MSCRREYMEAFVSKQYGGSWPEKVRRMPDEQVAAIYLGMILRDGREKKPEKRVKGGEQLCLFEKGTLILKEEFEQ